jgi:hypothetical protein
VEGHWSAEIGKDAAIIEIIVFEKVAHDVRERRVGLPHQVHGRQKLSQFLCAHRAAPACNPFSLTG